MRVPLMPLALSLAVGGLLYAAYQGNKRIVEAAASPPAIVSRAPQVGPVASTASTTANPNGPDDRELAAAPAAGNGDEARDVVDLSQLDERCTAIAAVASTSVDAIETDIPLEEFLRRPVIAFVNDPALRSELEQAARGLYERPPASVPGAQRDALVQARCP